MADIKMTFRVNSRVTERQTCSALLLLLRSFAFGRAVKQRGRVQRDGVCCHWVSWTFECWKVLNTKPSM